VPIAALVRAVVDERDRIRDERAEALPPA